MASTNDKNDSYYSDFDKLEETIEIARLDQNWQVVKEALQDYSKVFEIIYEVKTNYHFNGKEMKAYYWICLSEYTFHTSGDFTASIDCLRRASAFNYSSSELRMLIVRYFLISCYPTVIKYKSIHSQAKNPKKLINFDMESLQLYLYLGDYAKVR
jgi:hypothetical protein